MGINRPPDKGDLTVMEVGLELLSFFLSKVQTLNTNSCVKVSEFKWHHTCTVLGIEIRVKIVQTLLCHEPCQR